MCETDSIAFCSICTKLRLKCKKSNVQIGTNGSNETLILSESKSEELTEILNQLKGKMDDSQVEQKIERTNP